METDREDLLQFHLGGGAGLVCLWSRARDPEW